MASLLGLGPRVRAMLLFPPECTRGFKGCGRYKNSTMSGLCIDISSPLSKSSRLQEPCLMCREASLYIMLNDAINVPTRILQQITHCFTLLQRSSCARPSRQTMTETRFCCLLCFSPGFIQNAAAAKVAILMSQQIRRNHRAGRFNTSVCPLSSSLCVW